eukprot:Nitzschia sp. Nitz4//scaffold225_size51843//38194//39676//NITZ4_006902-RA/size51843-snap-gene-0.4-mRNA-1//1//CDS//3329542696//2566//frame0
MADMAKPTSLCKGMGEAVESKTEEASCTGTAASETPCCADEEETRATCDVLCSLGACAAPAYPPSSNCSPSPSCTLRPDVESCAKQHQLPMFLSKTYHMIDRCDPAVATWSAEGDNFVVKNVEKFASVVLPLYFKHSNFSSFARQLNFYGFRKLRTDPILTSDVDPNTACYVRFYHEKFQKNRPELLHQIKRATKSDQQSKDDVESLKHEVCKLKDCIGQMSTEMDRKLAEMSYEYNRRITALSAEYDKLAALVTQILARSPSDTFPGADAAVAAAATRVPDLMHSLSQVAAMSLQSHLRPALAAAAAAAATSPAPAPSTASRSLGAVAAAAIGTAPSASSSGTPKRSAPEEEETSNTRPRTS